MSKLIGKVIGFFRSRSQVGVDKAGNAYFSKMEEVDGFMKEKRSVTFKGEQDPTSIPVEWISWLNGQRKKPPTPEEMLELEARRECVKLNIEILKQKEEEERKSKINKLPQKAGSMKSGGPDLRSFIQQFPDALPDQQKGPASGRTDEPDDTDEEIRSTEPTGSGQSFKPGTWQPPT